MHVLLIVQILMYPLYLPFFPLIINYFFVSKFYSLGAYHNNYITLLHDDSGKLEIKGHHEFDNEYILEVSMIANPS